MGSPSAVVVVGAGLSGLTAAADLSGSAVPVLVVAAACPKMSTGEAGQLEYGPPILYERGAAIENVFLAGDWIGPTGELADASVASSLRAARAVERLVVSS